MNSGKILSVLKRQLGEAGGGTFEVKFAFPFLQICVTNPAFVGIPDDERELFVAQRLGLGAAELRQAANDALLHYHWIAPGNPIGFPKKAIIGSLVKVT